MALTFAEFMALSPADRAAAKTGEQDAYFEALGAEIDAHPIGMPRAVRGSTLDDVKSPPPSKAEGGAG